MKIRISAVICTLDRAQYLRKALRSLVDQTLPREQYEIIVVDNGSTDETADMIRDEFTSAEKLCFVREAVLGLSQARNTGWRTAKGEYIAFLDDDAIASPQWLETIINVFETIKPRPGCVGGKVDPIWEASRPEWLSDTMVPYLTVVSWSDTPMTMSENQWLAGANMAFPRVLLESAGGFFVGLDRKGRKLLSMGDVQLQRELEKRGYRCFYHPAVAVQHHVPASRLTKDWFVRRSFWQGVSDALMQIHRESLAASKRIRLGFRVAMSVPLSRRQLFHLITPTNDPERFALKCSVIAKIGYVSGLWGVAK